MNPSQEALKLAEAIHYERQECPIPMSITGLALLIDRELALPQRNAALLLAQGVADVVDRDYKHLENLDMQCDELRDALAAIPKTK